MNQLRKLLFFTLLAAVFCATATAAPIFELIPADGAVAGLPGDVVGWGFTLTNDTDYVVVTSSDFVPGSPLGTYTDFIGPNFIVVGPPPESTVVSQVFDPVALTGVGSFAISPSAMFGDTAVGEIQLTYDLFSRSPNDPNFNPATDTISVGNLLSQPASVAVVPEPASWLLVGIAGAALAVLRKRR
jgi:hypothetical protein